GPSDGPRHCPDVPNDHEDERQGHGCRRADEIDRQWEAALIRGAQRVRGDDRRCGERERQRADRCRAEASQPADRHARARVRRRRYATPTMATLRAIAIGSTTSSPSPMAVPSEVVDAPGEAGPAATVNPT